VGLLRGAGPTPHNNIDDISGKLAIMGFGGSSSQSLSYPGFCPRGIYPRVFIPGAFIAQGIHLTGHSPHKAFIPREFDFRAIRRRGFCSRGIVPRGSQAVKMAPVGDLYVCSISFSQIVFSEMSDFF